MNIIIWTSARTIYIHINVHYWLLASWLGPPRNPGFSSWSLSVLHSSPGNFLQRRKNMPDHGPRCCLFSIEYRWEFPYSFISSLRLLGGVEWGREERARVRGHPPEWSAGQKREVTHSWLSLQKVWRGQTVLVCSFFCVVFFCFLFFCKSVKKEE